MATRTKRKDGITSVGDRDQDLPRRMFQVMVLARAVEDRAGGSALRGAHRCRSSVTCSVIEDRPSVVNYLSRASAPGRGRGQDRGTTLLDS